MAQLANALALILVACYVQALPSVSAAVAVATAEAWSKEEQAIRSVPRITIDELKVLMAQKAALVLDVREPGAFAKGRIPGAINIDYTQILARGAQFSGEQRTIVAYCACANEMTAARAAVDLAARGIPGAKALKGGWDEWLSRGERIER